MSSISGYFFFFNDTATTEIYTLSLHDALPILRRWDFQSAAGFGCLRQLELESISRGLLGFPPAIHGRLILAPADEDIRTDRKSTRLNSSHSQISYAVFCLKKKKSSTRQPASSW